ncbi:carbohydrate-binding protein [Gynuella sunshinyii]|uniref:Pectate lyase n=1 Tax=Gynuella sunshinyii YC6258 TaxID=1445510 RepID=A0A0C5VRG4_9GAMM|nr:carbohydrate-binding protein [Gynuella sunshinyii]AJQ92844.1 pectate lyase [Gynuella sunshinyii YC6258]
MIKPLLFISGVLLLTACGGEETSIKISTTDKHDTESSIDNTNSTPSTDADIDTADNSGSNVTESLIIQENEDGFCGLDGQIEKEHTGFTSMGYANTDNINGAEIRWSVNASEAGSYAVKIRYANRNNEARPGNFWVNGTVVSLLDIGTTGDWSQYVDSGEVSLSLNKGNNSITLKATTEGGLPNVDYIQILSSTVSPGNCSGSDAEDNQNDNNNPDDGSSGSDDTGNNGDGDQETPSVTAGCEELIKNPAINWRESALQSDQEIVACLSESLGRPVGFGENTTGGYDANGSSHLVVIHKNTSETVEQQLFNAISSSDYNWIVFDKRDFAEETDISLHRLFCSDNAVLAALDNASEAECQNPKLWCENHNVSTDNCLATFYNDRLNDASLPIRNRMIDSNTTIDGRGANAYMLFNGFSIGSDSKGTSTHISENVIITNMEFRGAGHTEDHNLDPDMIRSTGESHNIWIHQNTFDTTGDSAWDIKVGAYDITLSFNKLIDVKRAGLMGSSDSRTINEQIKATMHNNLFVTLDQYYSDKKFDTLRRVPLMRRGQAHMFNNVFYGYRKDILSVRVGGRILFENNMVLNNAAEAAAKKDDMSYFINTLMRDFREGGLEIRDSSVWFSDASCQLQGEPGDLTASHGSTPEMAQSYSARSQEVIQNNQFSVGQDLADYLYATTGKGGEIPYLSPYAQDRYSVISLAPETCQQESKAGH